MKAIFTALFIASSFVLVAQGPPVSQPQPDCENAENICSDNGSLFQLSTGSGLVDDLPNGSTISNPTMNPGGAGNSGCLLASELNPNWFVINVGTAGVLEFTIGGSGGSGYYDWSMWPYDQNACSNIQNNTLPPAACNWNASSQGFTGMYSQGSLPNGAIQGNFEYAIPVQPGDQFILCFSNYSSLSGNVPLTFGNDIIGNNNPNSAMVSCYAATADQTICNGDVATVSIIAPAVTNPTYNWLVTTGVSNPTGGTNVLVSPTVTTEYYVEIFDQGGGLYGIDTFTVFVVDPPNPDAGPDQNVCFGDQIQLAGSMDDPVNNTMVWQYDDSQVNPTPNVIFNPSNTDLNAIVTVDQLGSYFFILRESNAVCGNQYDTMTCVVSELQITATANAPTCEGFSDGEIHIDSPEAIEYSFDGGATWQVDSFSVILNNGTYTVCGRSALGCEKCVDVDVIDPPLVTISVSNDTLICQNGTAYMSASATGGTSYLFHWDHTGDTSPAQNVNPLAQTTYTVFAENEVGCISENASIIVSVRDPLTGTISEDDTICPGYPTDIYATVIGGIGQPYTFDWTSGDSFTGVGAHSINVNPPATLDYTVTITDGCESTPLVLTSNIRVAPLPVPQYEVLDPIQCEPAIFHIINTTDPAMSQYEYWEIDGIHQYLNVDTVVTPVFMYGDYELYMMVTSYEGCVDSIRIDNALHVQPKPVANFVHAPNPVTAFNTTVEFQNLSFLGDTYQWYFDGGYPSASALEDPTVQFPDGVTGTYNVTLITTSELGCVDTMLYELVVMPEILIYAPNAFTPDGDEFNQGWRIFMEGVDIYDFELTVYDRWGEIVWESHNIEVSWDGTYAGHNLPPGTYVWTIETKDALNDNKLTYTGHVNLLR